MRTDGILGLIDNGMNLARLNFSHGDHEGHAKTVSTLRAAAMKRPDAHVGIMVDIKGPGLRTGLLDPSLNGKLTLTTGDEFEMGTVFFLSSYPLCENIEKYYDSFSAGHDSTRH